jgi:hypothetical protein
MEVEVVLVTIILAVVIQHLLVGLVVLVEVVEEMIMEIGHQEELEINHHQHHHHKEILAAPDGVNQVGAAAVVLEVQVVPIKLVVLVFNFQRLSKIQHLNQDHLVVDLVIRDLVDIIGLLVVEVVPIMVAVVGAQVQHHMQVLVKVALILQYLAHQVE